MKTCQTVLRPEANVSTTPLSSSATFEARAQQVTLYQESPGQG